MRVLATVAVTVLGLVPAGLFGAAIWTAHTLSYSEKLADTGLLSLLAVPAIVGLGALTWTVVSDVLERRSS